MFTPSDVMIGAVVSQHANRQSTLTQKHRHTHATKYLKARPLNSPAGSASAVKEPGHFEVRKSFSQVTRMHFFSSKKLTIYFSCRPQNTGRQHRFNVIKNAGLSRVEPELEPGRWIFQRGHLTWRPLV